MTYHLMTKWYGTSGYNYIYDLWHHEISGRDIDGLIYYGHIKIASVKRGIITRINKNIPPDMIDAIKDCA